jgi:hypothetical protein
MKTHDDAVKTTGFNRRSSLYADNQSAPTHRLIPPPSSGIAH